MGRVLRNVPRPSFGDVEANDANRVTTLAVQQIGNDCFEVLPCGGASPYRVACCPSFAAYRYAPCDPSGRHRALALANRGRSEHPRRAPGLAHAIAAIAGRCALVARERSGVGW